MIVFIATIISCLVFDRAHVWSTSKQLMTSYQKLPYLLNNAQLSDAERQQALIQSATFQLKNLVLLCLKMGISLAPFLLLFAFDFELQLLFQLQYILIAMGGAISYLLLKKLYEKVLKNQ